MTPSQEIFISYRRTDAAAVDTLVLALENIGLTVWIDRREIDDAASIQARIDDGLAQAGVLLAWFSADYLASRACQWEITAALIAARAEPAPQHRVLAINPEANNRHIQPLAARNIQHFAAPTDLGDAAGFAALAQRIAAAIAAIPGPLGALRRLAAPPCHGFKPLGSNRFVGRVGDLWQIHDALARGDYAIVAGQPSPQSAGQLAQVQGSGGIGKSLLTEEYALRFGSFWPGGIFWLRANGNPDNPAESPEALARRRAQEYSSQLANFALDLAIDVTGLDDSQLRRSIGQQLGKAALPYLWIVDDLPECKRVELDNWLAPGAPGQTLLTTRSRRLDGVGFVLALELLPETDARALLTLNHPPRAEEESLVADILRHLDGHALALDVAREACQRQGYAGFLTNLQHPSRDALELAALLAPELPNGHNPSIAATFLAGFADLNDAARDFLRLAAQLATAPIERELVAACFCVADHLQMEDAEARADLGMQQALQRSLAEPVIGQTAVSVHTLISRSLRFHDQDSARQAALSQAAVIALNIFMAGGEDIRQHPLLKNIVIHASLLADGADDLPRFELAARIGRYDLEAGRYQSARHRIEAADRGRRKLLGEEHPDTLANMNNLAETLRALGDLSAARTLQEQVLASCHRVLGEEHPDTLTSVNNLASTLKAQGELSAARMLEEQALAICRRVLGEEHPNTLFSMNNLAYTHRIQGDLPAARALHEQELNICRRVLGAEHRDTLVSMGNLASTLMTEGNLPSARALQEQTLAIRRRVLGEEHPDTLIGMGDLAGTLGAQGDLPGARALQEHVLTISGQVLGENHAATIKGAWNLFLTTLQLADTGTSDLLLQRHLLPLLDDPSPPANAALQAIREQRLRYLADVAAASKPPTAR